MKILLLTTDAFGGHGGIAQYNRDLITALSDLPEVDEIVAIPRYIPHAVGRLPPKLTYCTDGSGGKGRYVKAVLKAMGSRFDLVICGHVNLLALAWMASVRNRAPLVVLVYGIDVWRPHKSLLVRALLSRVEVFWSISEITRDKMAAWSKISPERFRLLPNAIALERYGLAPKDENLTERYGLGGRKVMMILARLASYERYKGVDELLEIMPILLQREPEIAFLVAGDGDDRSRLEQKAKTLGIAGRVVFAGYVAEQEKAAHFRLADNFVMPGRCEGFGFVFLEAMACGVPVVASSLDGSREAVRFGELGELVNPNDRAALTEAIILTLNAGKHIPVGLDYFSFANFRSRLHALVLSSISE